MSSFAPFADAVKRKFDEMSKGELFLVGTGREAWTHYLASFPEGTNPIYLERTEHDCECCKQFVRNIGNVVSIVEGKRTTIWDLKGLESPYKEVAAAMVTFLADKPIESVYRVAESKYGAQSTKQLLANGSTKKWDHFYGTVPNKFLTDRVGTLRGEYGVLVQVFERGLVEINPQAIVDVLDLIADKNLYRGEESLETIKAFQKMQKHYNTLTNDTDKNTYVWENANGRRGTQIRASAMGDLLVDLSGVPISKWNKNVPDIQVKAPLDLEAAVGLFEFKMDPDNFKRSKALVTPKMKTDAMAFIRENDLEDSLKRRFAKLSDVSVNNVLWVDAVAQTKMKDSLDALFDKAPTKPVQVKEDQAEDITMDEFMATILPRVQSMELFVRNSKVNNFVSLTAPVYADAKNMFKWNNDFAWSYNGNIADSSLRQRVQSAGGRVDGVLRFSHTWNYDKRNASLMDLHVFMPGCGPHEDGCHNNYPNRLHRVGWNERTHGASGGKQDVDYTEAAPVGYIPVENITFPDLSRLKQGEYVFKIHNWDHRPPTEGGFKAEIEFGGQVFQYEHDKPMKHKEWKTVAVATLKAGQFTIEHKMPHGASSQTVWGVDTEKFVKVNTLMMSPNFWDEQKVGNKHWFFMLDGCINDDSTRGFYNEFLNSDFEKHRKVFEILGGLTQCEPTNDQISGMGFSSTRNDTVLLKVTGNKLFKTYNVKF